MPSGSLGSCLLENKICFAALQRSRLIFFLGGNGSGDEDAVDQLEVAML